MLMSESRREGTDVYTTVKDGEGNVCDPRKSDWLACLSLVSGDRTSEPLMPRNVGALRTFLGRSEVRSHGQIGCFRVKNHILAGTTFASNQQHRCSDTSWTLWRSG